MWKNTNIIPKPSKLQLTSIATALTLIFLTFLITTGITKTKQTHNNSCSQSTCTLENPSSSLIKKNTMYLICNYQNNSKYREYCEKTDVNTVKYTSQNNITLKKLDTHQNKTIAIMQKLQTKKYPLYIYNTKKTPSNKNCWMYGTANQEILKQFTSQCKETGTYNATEIMKKVNKT